MKCCVPWCCCGSKSHRGLAAALPGKLACSGTAVYQLGPMGKLSLFCQALSFKYGSQTAAYMPAGCACTGRIWPSSLGLHEGLSEIWSGNRLQIGPVFGLETLLCWGVKKGHEVLCPLVLLWLKIPSWPCCCSARQACLLWDSSIPAWSNGEVVPFLSGSQFKVWLSDCCIYAGWLCFYWEDKA
jgi:hypothetical protein